MATQKLVDYIVGLTADTGPSSDDLIITVNAPGGTPANRKVTIADLFQNIPGAKVTSGQLLLPDGLVSAPSLLWTDIGFFRLGALDLGFSVGGVVQIYWGTIAGDGYLQLLGSCPSLYFSSDVILTREAANTLGLRHAANAQTFNWYATYTDASNYEGGYLTAAAGSVTLGARTAGTGTDNIDLLLVPAGTGAVGIGSTQAAGALTGTLTNSVATGNPTVYFKIKSGASYYAVPGWLIP
jgi:hypothetical protein